eukprot:INCI4650.3.p1 GENE.INCI4650.3~~INCI4650.3.p1  ORF type:complete len:974 (-),score=117.26 INCI4650.3:17-2938(-)
MASSASRYVALYDFDDIQEGELAFSEGETLWAIAIPESTDWLFAQNSQGDNGNIPATFVQLAPESPTATSPPPPPPPSRKSRKYGKSRNRSSSTNAKKSTASSSSANRRSLRLQNSPAHSPSAAQAIALAAAAAATSEGHRRTFSPQSTRSSPGMKSAMTGTVGARPRSHATSKSSSSSSSSSTKKGSGQSSSEQRAKRSSAKHGGTRAQQQEQEPPRQQLHQTHHSNPKKIVSKTKRNTLRLKLPPGSLGVRLAPDAAGRICVDSVGKGSSAESIGLQPGDQLVSINGKDLSRLPKDQAFELIGSCTQGKERILVVARLPPALETSPEQHGSGGIAKGQARRTIHSHPIVRSKEPGAKVSNKRHSVLKRLSSSLVVPAHPSDGGGAVVSSTTQSGTHSQLETLPGEIVHMNVERVEYVNPFEESANEKGLLVVTNYQICFLSYRPGFLPRDLFCVPCGTIERADLVENKKSPVKHILLCCKDTRRLRFRLPAHLDASGLITVVNGVVFPKLDRSVSLPAVFALKCKYDPEAHPVQSSMWQRVQMDHRRMGVEEHEKLRPCVANVDYEICESYPSAFVIPRIIPDTNLKAVAEFRSSGRIPVFCWLHQKNGAMLWRCSQPRVGVQGKRSSYDEEFLMAIHGCSQNKKKTALIADCRPKTYAIANMAKGKGFERKANYPYFDIEFLGIGNIHDVRSTFKKLDKLVNGEPGADLSWLSSVESTGWLAMLRTILIGSVLVAKAICLDNRSVVVHCSDGWDRTAQVVALSELMMDPFYRTTEGLRVLIEREWVFYGHQFQTRLGHGIHPDDDSERGDRSPVFLQFLDCIWQLMNMYQRHFEYSQEVVLCLAYHCYSCRFGNFLGNTERQRSNIKLDRTTPCIWQYMQDPARRTRFVNAFYDANAHPHALLPTAMHLSQSVQLWSDYFLRWIQYATMHMEPDEVVSGTGLGDESLPVTLTQQFRKFDTLNVTMHGRDE